MGYLTDFLKACSRRTRADLYFRDKVNTSIRKYIDAIFLPLGLLNYCKLSMSNKSTNHRDGLAIVAILKNESEYIEEWICYHKLLGCKHFYLYDNDSTDNIGKVLLPYINTGLVTLNKISGKKRQYDAYNDALNRYGKKYKFMAFIDIDEFIFSPTGDNIVDVIDKLIKGKNGGVGINWMVFGSSGKKRKTNKLVIENFLYHAYDEFDRNKHIKTICDPLKVLGFVNPHYPIFLQGYCNINCKGERLDNAFSNYDGNTLRINHYFTKSLEEYEKKKARGKADQTTIREENDFDIHDRNEVYDDSMLKMADDVKKLIIDYREDKVNKHSGENE